MQTPKIAFLPGTFNPIHKAHVDIAKRAKTQYGFDKVIFVTYNNQPHKHNKELPTVEDRFNMIHLAIKSYKYMDVLGIEFKEGSITDFNNLVQVLKKLYRQKRVNILISDDSFLQGAVNWGHLRDIYNNARFFINPRYNYLNIIERNKMDKAVSQIVNKVKRYLDYMWNSVFNLSSTEIREGKKDTVMNKVLPQETRRYLEQTRIYNSSHRAGLFNLQKHLSEDTAMYDKVFDELPQLKQYSQIKPFSENPAQVRRILMKDPIKL